MRLIWSFNRARAEMVANENFAGAFRRAELGESVEHRHGGQMPEARYRLRAMTSDEPNSRNVFPQESCLRHSQFVRLTAGRQKPK